MAGNRRKFPRSPRLPWRCGGGPRGRLNHPSRPRRSRGARRRWRRRRLAAVVSARAAAVVAVVAAAWTKYTAIIMRCSWRRREAVLAVNYGGRSRAPRRRRPAWAAWSRSGRRRWRASPPSSRGRRRRSWWRRRRRRRRAPARWRPSIRCTARRRRRSRWRARCRRCSSAWRSRCSSPRRAPPARTNDELYADLKAAAGTAFKVPPLPADVAPARWMAVRGLPAAVPPQRLLLAFPHARRVEAIYAADGARLCDGRGRGRRRRAPPLRSRHRARSSRWPRRPSPPPARSAGVVAPRRHRAAPRLRLRARGVRVRKGRRVTRRPPRRENRDTRE